jgi:drug/metabolite transporter (DMT)-like permease
VIAVALALTSAALFGVMTIAVRLGLRRQPDPDAAALATVLPALAVAVCAAGIEGGLHGVDLAAAWPFLLAGLLAPGGSQILFTLAIRDAGASRTSVAVGTAPLVSVAIALVALHEPLKAPLLVGALLIVAGGVALASERTRPEHLRAIGLVFAACCTVLFATRDNLVRWLATDGTARPALAAAATLLTGSALATLYARRVPSRSQLRAFVLAGLCFGLSYIALFEAFYRGRVSVVSPLVATESLFGVTLAALFVRHEGIGRRIVVGALLVVAGGALIGGFR